MAAITAIGGVLCLIGLRPSRLFKSVKHMPVALWFLFGLLVLGVVSSFWSPYNSPRTLPNPYILLIGVPLYLAFTYAVATRSRFNDAPLSRIVIFTTIGSAIAILLDRAFGFPISMAVDPIDVGESKHQRYGDVIQNLNHGISVLTLFLPPVVMMLWVRNRIGKFLALVLIALILACTLVANLNASLVAVIAACLFMIIASKRPIPTLKLSFYLALASLVFAPIVAFFMTKLSDAQLAALPFSWEERVHNWAFMYDMILEHPIMGHGFDAVRTFSESHTIRGFEGRALVSLHPHNAGIHIWVETGLIGIAFASLALFYAGKRLCRAGTLSTGQSIAVSGLIVSAMANSILTYGVWQDWWWASIVIASSVIFLITHSRVD